MKIVIGPTSLQSTPEAIHTHPPSETHIITTIHVSIRNGIAVGRVFRTPVYPSAISQVFLIY